MIAYVRKVFNIARILSIDVAAGACVCSLFIAHSLSVKLPLSCVLALGVCVWLIYTADHLLDAQKVKHKAHSSRHYFHQKYYKNITIIFIVLAFCSMSLLFFLPKIVLTWGLVLMGFVIIYFLLVILLKPTIIFQKEVMAALLYAVGVFLAPVSLANQPITLVLIVIFAQFVLLALINLLMFSLFEKENDLADGHSSFVRLAGVKVIRWLVIGLTFLVVASTLIYIYYLPTHAPMFKVEVMWLLMSLTLTGIFLMPSVVKKYEIYRIVGDSIFFFPLITLLF